MKTIRKFKSSTLTKLALMMVLLATATLQAQGEKLTLKDAVKYALQNKAEAKKARLDVENSEYKIQEVRALALPTVMANGNLTYNAILQQNALPGDFFGAPGTTILAPLGQEWVSTAGVSLDQTIFDQTVFTGLKAAKSTREFYQVNAQLTDQDVTERVANNYYQVYVLREQLKVLTENYANNVKVRDIIKGQYENGLARKIDLDRINVNVSNVSAAKNRVTNSLQQQENALKFYIGMPMNTSIIFPESEFEVSPQALNEAPDVTQRLEYQLVKKQEELLYYQKKAYQAEYYPTLSLNANYNYLGQGPDMPWFKKPADGTYWTDYSALSLNLKVPIFNGFGTRARVRQATVELQKVAADLEDTKIALDMQYSNAVSQTNTSLINIENQKENMILAEDVRNNTQNNYQNGLSPLTDVLDAENSYIAAQNSYINAVLDFKLAEIQLLKAKGTLNTLTN
jgi:outer membrane protein TolC